MSELKPCPFCKESENIHITLLPTVSCGKSVSPEDSWKAMKCQLCGATGPMSKDPEEARKLWNTRTPAPAEVEGNLVGAMWNKKDNTFVCQSCGTKHELGHFRVVKPDEEVEELEAGKEYDMTVRVRIESDIAKMEKKPCLWVVIDGDSRKLEAWLRHAKPTFRKAGE